MFLKKRYFVALAAVVAGFASGAGAQTPYPVKPVRVIVAFAAGGFADRTARLVGQKLGERLGQPFVMDNRGGAGGNIAARNVVEATPDGYTLLVHTAALSINVSLYKDIGFDLEKDLVPVAMTGSAPGLFTVSAGHPANNLRDLIQLAKVQGKPLAYATAGVGTSSHLAAEYLFNTLAGVPANHIPFKGGAPATTAVLGGQVELLSASLGGALAFVKQGKMKALAVSSLTRIDDLPNVPTVSESGFPGFEERSWVAFFAPAKTPSSIVSRLNEEINRILVNPEVKSTLVSQGTEVTALSQQDFAAKLASEIALWRKIVNITGAKPE
ncbi:MAG: Bug family tripartite tricarboxylate transporter substrate binding protein [Burkholderiales bacterium]